MGRESRLLPNGRVGATVLAARAPLAVAATESSVRLWDPLTGVETVVSRAAQAAGHARAPDAVLVSPAGDAIATTDPNALAFWDPQIGRAAGRSNAAFQTAVAFTANGKSLLAVRLSDGLACEREVPSGKVLREFRLVEKQLACAVATADGQRIAAADGETVYLFDGTGTELRRWAAPQALEPGHRPATLALAADGSALLVGGRDGSLRLLSGIDGSELTKVPAGGPVFAVALAADAKAALAAFETEAGTEVARFDLRTGKETARYGAAVKPVPGAPRGARVALSACGTQVARAEGHAVKVYDARTGKVAHEFAGHRAAVGRLAFAPDGRALVSVATDGVGFVWRLPAK